MRTVRIYKNLSKYGNIQVSKDVEYFLYKHVHSAIQGLLLRLHHRQ